MSERTGGLGIGGPWIQTLASAPISGTPGHVLSPLCLSLLTCKMDGTSQLLKARRAGVSPIGTRQEPALVPLPAFPTVHCGS